MGSRWFGAKLAILGGLGALAAGCQSVEPHVPPLPQARTPQTKPSEPAAQVRVASAAMPAEAENVVDLAIALRLAGVENPTINLAREAVREAVAGQLAARVLLLPNVNAGGNYRRHEGALMTAPGVVRDVDSQSLYLGWGAGAVGSGAVYIPGVRLFANLGDAAYEPLAARQRVNARQSNAVAVQNEILLKVAVVYLQLVGAESRLEILRRGEADLGEIVRVTVAFAKAGQGRQADAHRTEATADLLRSDVRRAEEEIAVAKAQLCRLLNLDPSVLLRTPGGAVQPLRLIPEDSDVESLIAEAVRARPELFAQTAAIQEALTRLRQERVRPWLPTVAVGYSYAGFGGGSNETLDPFTPLKSRSDFSALAVWTGQNLGFGNRARVRRADAVVGETVADFDRIMNQVRREVTEALADAHAAARQITTAESSLSAAEEGFRLESERLRQGQGLPIEVLDSFRQLLESRQELLRATIAFNVAQFRLFVALGRTPHD